jgi:hypothetical protein
VADELGSAVLRLAVDDTEARKSLEKFRQSIEAFKPNFTAVERGLKAVASQADQAAAKVQSLNQVLSQAPGASFSKITSQIQRLSQEAKNLKLNSDEYLKTLTRISELEFVRGARSGRQRVNADASAASGAVLNAGYGAPDRLPGLPSTVAADQQRIRELTFRLKNLEIGSSAFEQTQRELEAVQRQVAEATDGVSEAFRRQQLAQDGVIRRAEKLKALQNYYSDINPRAGGTRDPNTGAMLARGSGAASDERAYRSALGASQELLATDLRRLQVIREITQRLGQAQTSRTGSQNNGFAAFSARDPVTSSIERNARKQQQRDARLQSQRDVFDSDLSRVRERRLEQERKKEEAKRLQQEQLRAKKRADAEKQRLAKERQARNDDALSSGLIGGGFPLLFGQGIGASLGGGIGGTLGGLKGGGFGFALSIVGTAVGAQFDAIIAKSTALGQALQSPISNFSLVQQNALLSSKGLEKHVASLIAAGREAEAAALIQKDLAASYGGAEQAAELAKQQDILNRSWSNLSINLGGFALQPLAEAAGAASTALSGLRAILDRIAGFVPPQVRDGVSGVGKSIATSGLLNATGLQGVAAGLGFFGAFAPKPKAATGITADPAADRQRLSLLIAQNRVVSAQAQGYKKLALEREVTLSQEQEALDLQRLRANKAGSPELQARQQQGDQERQRLKEEIAQLKRQQERDNKVRAATGTFDYQISAAQVDGRQREALQLQIQRLEAERRSRLESDPANASKTRGELDPQIFTAKRQLAQLDRERLVTQTELNAQNAIELGALQRQISAAQTLATTEGDRTRSELQRRQQLQEAIAASRDRERSLGASIDAARLRGGDAGEQEAARLVEQQKLAAETTRLKLIEGADALRQAGKALNEDLTSAVLKLTEIRSSPEGLNRFLSASDQQKRGEQDLQRLLPQFRQAQEQFRGLTGAAAPEFSGSTQDVNAAIRDFITSVKAETDATKGLNDVQKALSDNTAALAAVTAELLTATGNLAAKNWAVNVAVNADGSSAAYGDVLNRAI